MNTKNNRRRRQSVERLETMFMDLLQEMELREIAVADLCKRCGLNRSTFYANYLDIFDMAEKVRKRLEEEVVFLFDPENISGSDYLNLFRHMRENRLRYLTYFRLGGSRYDAERYDRGLAQRYFDQRYVHYHMEFFRGGFDAIVKMWLDNGCRETPEEMAEIISSEYQGRA